MSAEVIPMSANMRPLPFNIEAEVAVLGTLLVVPKAWESVSQYLSPHAFADKRHGLIFQAMQELKAAGRELSPIAFKDICEDGYAMKIATAAATPSNAKEYARLIRDLYLKRQAIPEAEAALEDLYSSDPTKDPGAIRIGLEAKFADLFEAQAREGDPLAMPDVTQRALQWAEDNCRRGDAGGIKTGLVDIDRAIGGMQAGDLVIVAARPGMGKSLLAGQIAYRTAEAGIPVAVFSLEMSAEQFQIREMAARSGVDGHAIRLGQIGAPQFDKLTQVGADLDRLPMWIDDRGGLTVQQIFASAKGLHRRKPLGLIVVDYLQLVVGQPGEKRYEIVTNTSQRMKALGKEIGCPVIALSQLSRACESRDPPKPQLSDLRESGSVEQDADIVGFLYRESYYVEQKKPQRTEKESDQQFTDRRADHAAQLAGCQNKAEFILAKNRHGPTTTIDLSCDLARFRFRNAAREQENEGMPL